MILAVLIPADAETAFLMMNRETLEAKKSDVRALKARLDALRPFPEATLRSLREAMALEWTYHSNAIEGNTLTLKETKVVLEGITVGGKSVREHLEAINHRHAIDFLEQIVSGNEAPSERTIKEIHQLVLKGIDDAKAGRWRGENVVISGAKHRPPDHLHLPQLMADFVSEWKARTKSDDALERAAWVHSEFVRIHPFVDGNGRTGRLLMNLELMKDGYPPAIIRKEDRLAYYEALDKAHVENDATEFEAMVCEAVAGSIEMYLEVVG